MRSRRLPLPALALAPALASCAFILDFDSLQAEKDSGQGGVLLTGGSAGRGGSDGMTAGDIGFGGNLFCPAECFDDDPCTVDGCDSNEECLSDVAVGLVLDGIDETVLAEKHYRVTAAAGDDDFFLSAFSVGADGPQVALYRLAAEGSEFSPIGTLTGTLLGDVGEPVSAAGLAVQPASGLLHAFVAMKRLTGDGARVRRVVIDTRTFDIVGGAFPGDSYWDVSPYNYPVATTLEDLPAVAWINEDQTIGLDGGGLERTETLSADTQAMAIGLVASEDDQPEVIYGTTDGIFVERPGEDPVGVRECQTTPGGYLSFTTAFTTVPGFWLAGWTKFGVETADDPAFLTTEGTGMYCGAGRCLVPERECTDATLNNLVHNVATSVVHRPGTRAGLVEVVQATPAIEAGEEPDSVIARVDLAATSVDFGIPPFENDAVSEPLGTPIRVSSQETSEDIGFRGPDWPVIAQVPPDRYVVAWIEPAAAGDALRVQRYRLCLP